jgi:hypothetical protein
MARVTRIQMNSTPCRFLTGLRVLTGESGAVGIRTTDGTGNEVVGVCNVTFERSSSR